MLWSCFQLSQLGSGDCVPMSVWQLQQEGQCHDCIPQHLAHTTGGRGTNLQLGIKFWWQSELSIWILSEGKIMLKYTLFFSGFGFIHYCKNYCGDEAASSCFAKCACKYKDGSQTQKAATEFAMLHPSLLQVPKFLCCTQCCCLDVFVKDPVGWLCAQHSSNTICVQDKWDLQADQLFTGSFNMEKVKTSAHDSSATFPDTESPG